MFIVIGSGPAGIAAAKCLLHKKHKVTLLDVGFELEPERNSMLDSLRSTPYEAWDKKLLQSIHENMQPDIKGLPKKLLFGSDFPFRHPESCLDVQSKEVDVLVCHARGGLSRVWGANVLPLLDSDLGAWPFKLSELTPYYKKIFEFVDLSARKDSLEELFPIHRENPKALALSKQARDILSDLEKHKEKLRAAGIYFGQSRLAVKNNSGSLGNECIYCGHCLYGCPYDLIYSSAITLKELLKDSNFTYQPNCFVERIEENGEVLKVFYRNLKTGSDEQINCERAFLGAGTVASSRIVLESHNAYDKDLLIRDSQYFLVPFLRFRGSSDVTKERLQTLSQVAINFLNAEISKNSVHVLIYTYNDLYLRAIKRLAGPLKSIAEIFSRPLLSRLVVMQGYLHSDESAAISLKVSKPSSGKRTISLQPIWNSKTKGTVKKLFKKIWKEYSSFGGIPLTPLLHMGAPGKSYHLGASLPMREKPVQFESDSLGRPYGFSRLHVVDASVFSDVPATNITLTIMANSYRIADKITD
jgi:choline dehydrogenase-like flavoprotein